MSLTEEQKERVRYLLDDEWVTDDEAESDRLFRQALVSIETPEELHCFAANFNWDAGCSVLNSVVEHPLCDHGTALLLFWLGSPEYYYRSRESDPLSDDEEEVRVFLHSLERAILDSKFKHRSIRVDPSPWVDEEQARQNRLKPDRRSDGLDRIPNELKQPSLGQPLPDTDVWAD